MADQQSTSSVVGNQFFSGMNRDLSDSFTEPNQWSYARNASKFTPVGDLRTLSNESSNTLCSLAPYTVIGVIHLYEDKWIIFSTDDTNSEIGLFDDSACSYSAVVQDPCNLLACPPCPPGSTSCTPVIPTKNLNFKKRYLIKGISKQNFDCSWQVYWADANNPDRTLNVGSGADAKGDQFFQCCCKDQNGCITYTPTCKIDCDKIKLASLVDSPCLTVNKARTGGVLLNGSYCATISYVINEQKVTDYFPLSNVQALFSHQNLSGALEITFTGLDTEHFSEFELVIVRNVNQQTSAKRIGIYSTHTQSILIDNINEELATIPIELIPIHTPVFEKSEAIYAVNNYAVRVAPTTNLDFNYQPLANRIRTKWISVEYPSDYYKKGGNVTSYLRDEVYCFFIRWIFDTGDRSSSYHIPGRVANPNELLPNNTSDSLSPGTELEFEVNNTASPDPIFTPYTLPDGGRVISKGDMAYWQSSELYPDNNPQIWNLSNWATVPGWSAVNGMGNPAYDLCATPIRHHKMPDNLIPGHVSNPTACAHIDVNAAHIHLLGVEFDRIALPLDNLGNPISGIVGYEILRGTREGNKTIIAKGIVNNMRGYNTISGQPGLYQNYPYNFRGADPTLRTAPSTGGWTIAGQPGTNLSQVRRDIFTFHSPDTQFKHPFLGVNELKTYGESIAAINGEFEDVPDHPKEKLLTDLAFLLSALVGVGEVMLAMRGQRIRRRKGPYVNNIGLWQDKYTVAKQNAIGGGNITGSGVWTVGTGTSTITGQPNSGGDRAAYDTTPLEGPTADNNHATGATAKTRVDTVQSSVYNLTTGSDPGAFSLSTLGQLLLGLADPGDTSAFTSLRGVQATPGINYYSEDLDTEVPKNEYIPQFFRILNGVQLASHYWTLGTDTALRLIQAVVPYRQYAYRYRSHGFYNNTVAGGSLAGNRRFGIPDINYLENHRQTFVGFEVNNLYRSSSVVVNTARIINDPITPDNSLNTIGTAVGLGPTFTKPQVPFSTRSSSYYTAIIQRIKSQYGQLDSVRQIPISCPQTITGTGDQTSSEVFGGDTYVCRYTEKNTFFYFYDWLNTQPDGTQFDYTSRYMITYPRYWANFITYDAGEFLQGLTAGTLTTPSDRAALDGNTPVQTFLTTPLGVRFAIKNAYFYLFQSGVRDFFVESEVNTDLRDWGELPEQRHYDPSVYESTYDLFKPDIIKSGNYYKYDYSLSISRLYQNFISWGNLQPRNYDPYIAGSCYIYRPNRLIYSLPQNLENKKDYWRVYLANNYKDFYSKVSVVKSINKSGIVIYFQGDSPVSYQGVDSLQTDLGTKITIGDGGLFSQPEQSVVNVDISYEYGSCQDRLSVINTPFGVFHICANQGKIFKLTQGLDDITYAGLKFWFREYLPYRLLQSFPNFDILDNPVAGIGCQSIYDNQTETVYFCKKDYQLKPQYIPGPPLIGPVNSVSYDPTTGKFDNQGTKFDLGDPIYFDDASWTVSFDPKSQQGGWISYHDWHPYLNIPSKNNFLTTFDRGIWRHNQSRNSFCNYYGINYPYEIEWIISTQTTVNTVRNIEYYMEAYKYNPGSLDRYHLLDFNFDHAVVYNSEQVSGQLDLVLTPKNNSWGRLGYPRLTLTPSFQTLYSKEEQKYRVNGWFDITRDRGEFPPFAQQMIWFTDPNGYTRTLNPNNLLYTKSDLQRKKFRHLVNRVNLKRNVCGDVNLVVKAAKVPELLSMR